MSESTTPSSKDRKTFPDRSPREEVYNAATHVFGFCLALAGGIAMIPRAANSDQPYLLEACIVFILGLLAVYACSAMSHVFAEERIRTRFRMLDQSFIYILIVASYTPFSIAFLNGTWWWCLLGLMWTIAIAGFTSKVFGGHRINSVSIWIYLALGWTPAMGGMPFTPLLPWYVLWSIIAGGVAYTLGTIFLYNDRRNMYFHAIWHLFVIAGSAIHYWAIMRFVLA